MENTKRHINIIDIAIVFLLIALVAGMFFRTYFRNANKGKSETSQIQYTFVIKSTNTRFRSLIKKGDTVYMKDNSEICGEVTAVSPTVSKVTVTDEDGNESELYDQSHIDILVTVSANALVSPNGLFIADGVFIAPGSCFDMYTINYEFSGSVQSVSTSSPRQ